MCIFSSVPASAMIFSKDLKISDANERCLDYHKASSISELEGPIRDSGFWPVVISHVRAALNGKSSIVEYAFKDPESGKDLWAKAAVAPCKDTSGNMLGVSVVERDVTFKREMLTELRQLNIA